MPDLRLLTALSLLAAVSAVLQVRAEYRGPRWRVYLCKPLTTALLLALAALPGGDGTGRYQIAVVVGLALSLAGDVFLMLPGDRFIPGLASFLLAHIAYLVAFTTGVPPGTRPAALLPFAASAGVLLAVLWPHLGARRTPVAAYVGAIVWMAWQALARALALGTAATALAAAGAALFVVSDAALALDRFKRPFRSARAVVMTTYVAAQWLIALSVQVR